MRHRPAAVVVASAAVVLSAAWAVNAHFISATGTVLADGALQVSWKEAGLGDNVNIDYLMATHATATYQCFNHGSNTPQGQPYSVDPQTLTASGTFASGKNGSITASLEAGPPDAAPVDAVLKCTSTNKRLCLVAVSYSGTTITDTTDNVSIGATPDPAERSFQGPTKRNPNPPNCTS